MPLAIRTFLDFWSDTMADISASMSLSTATVGPPSQSASQSSGQLAFNKDTPVQVAHAGLHTATVMINPLPNRPEPLREHQFASESTVTASSATVMQSENGFRRGAPFKFSTPAIRSLEFDPADWLALDNYTARKHLAQKLGCIWERKKPLDALKSIFAGELAQVEKAKAIRAADRKFEKKLKYPLRYYGPIIDMFMRMVVMVPVSAPDKGHFKYMCDYLKRKTAEVAAKNCAASVLPSPMETVKAMVKEFEEKVLDNNLTSSVKQEKLAAALNAMIIHACSHVKLLRRMPVKSLCELTQFMQTVSESKTGYFQPGSDVKTLLCAILATLSPAKQMVVRQCLHLCALLLGERKGIIDGGHILHFFAAKLLYRSSRPTTGASSHVQTRIQLENKLLRWMIAAMRTLAFEDKGLARKLSSTQAIQSMNNSAGGGNTPLDSSMSLVNRSFGGSISVGGKRPRTRSNTKSQVVSPGVFSMYSSPVSSLSASVMLGVTKPSSPIAAGERRTIRGPSPLDAVARNSVPLARNSGPIEMPARNPTAPIVSEGSAGPFCAPVQIELTAATLRRRTVSFKGGRPDLTGIGESEGGACDSEGPARAAGDDSSEDHSAGSTSPVDPAGHPTRKQSYSASRGGRSGQRFRHRTNTAPLSRTVLESTRRVALAAPAADSPGAIEAGAT